MALILSFCVAMIEPPSTAGGAPARVDFQKRACDWLATPHEKRRMWAAIPPKDAPPRTQTVGFGNNTYVVNIGPYAAPPQKGGAPPRP
jgi:hypothetical protein